MIRALSGQRFDGMVYGVWCVVCGGGVWWWCMMYGVSHPRTYNTHI